MTNIISHIIDRLVAKFEEHISVIQIVDEIVKVTQEQELGLETHLRKRKQTHESTLLTTSNNLDVSMPSIGGHRGNDISTKGGGTHEPMRCKFKCG